MQINEPASLWDSLAASTSESYICAPEARIPRSALLEGSILGGRGPELAGRSVVLLTQGQLATGLALLELDGVARRVTICSNEVSLDYLPSILETTEADSIVSDLVEVEQRFPRLPRLIPCIDRIKQQGYDRHSHRITEWIVFTSGTTGRPKLVVHTLSSLIGAIQNRSSRPDGVVWGTFYDIRRFGGMQVFLRSALAGSPLILSSESEPPSDFLHRAASAGVTHISGTPSQWRRALMSEAAGSISPDYIRMSGEVADQALLDRLRSTYPPARIVHAFGSSEAGTVFEVTDGLEGFPAAVLHGAPGVDMKIEEDTLRVRSTRTASRYLDEKLPPLRDAEGFVDTGDVVELRHGRYYFVGRRDGRINVGGLKVHPEEVEAIVGRHPEVQMCLVHAKKNPLTGAIVMADVVLRSGQSNGHRDTTGIEREILQLCREALPAYKRPAVIRVVPALMIAHSGKMARN